jgi:Protein of unknown function (DUF1513)
MAAYSRRNFLGRLGLAGGVLPFAADAQEALPREAGKRPQRLTGSVHGLGLLGRLFPGSEAGPDQGVNIVTSLDLATGRTRQTPVLMREGHTAMSMRDGRILCLAQHANKSLVLDPAHTTISELTSPERYQFSGHGLIVPDRNIFAVTLHHELQLDAKDYGLVHVYDLKTLKLLDEISTGGLQPHEIHPIPGVDELAVTHYGDIFSERKPFEHNVVDSKLTILDAATFRPKRHYPQRDFDAMVTHMNVDRYGWAYFVLTQYIRWPRLRDVSPGSDAFATASRLLDETMGRRRDFPLSPHSLEDHLLPVPLPFVRVNTQTGERQIINAGDQNHLRSQSVAYSREANKAVALYYHSDCLVVHGLGSEPEVITGEQLHLTDIRGVTEIPGTSLIAVMGTYRGISVMDLSDHTLVANYPTLNFCDTHLYYDAASIG